MYQRRRVLQEKVVRLLELRESRRFEVPELEMQVSDGGHRLGQSLLLHRPVFVSIKTDDAVDALADEEVDGCLSEILIAVFGLVVGGRRTIEFVSAGHKLGDVRESMPSSCVCHGARDRCEIEQVDRG